MTENATPTDDRGEKVVTVTREVLTHAVFRDGPARHVHLPSDVEIEELWHSRYGEGYRMRLSSTEWDAVAEGEELEEINPSVTSINDVAELKRRLEDLAYKWSKYGEAPDEACARELREVIEDYTHD